MVERDRSGRRVRLMGSGRVARVREAVRSVIGRGIMVLIDCCIYESRALNDRIFAHVDGRSECMSADVGNSTVAPEQTIRQAASDVKGLDIREKREKWIRSHADIILRLSRS